MAGQRASRSGACIHGGLPDRVPDWRTLDFVSSPVAHANRLCDPLEGNCRQPGRVPGLSPREGQAARNILRLPWFGGKRARQAAPRRNVGQERATGRAFPGRPGSFAFQEERWSWLRSCCERVGEPVEPFAALRGLLWEDVFCGDGLVVVFCPSAREECVQSQEEGGACSQQRRWLVVRIVRRGH